MTNPELMMLFTRMASRESLEREKGSNFLFYPLARGPRNHHVRSVLHLVFKACSLGFHLFTLLPTFPLSITLLSLVMYVVSAVYFILACVSFSSPVVTAADASMSTCIHRQTLFLSVRHCWCHIYHSGRSLPWSQYTGNAHVRN